MSVWRPLPGLEVYWDLLGADGHDWSPRMGADDMLRWIGEVGDTRWRDDQLSGTFQFKGMHHKYPGRVTYCSMRIEVVCDDSSKWSAVRVHVTGNQLVRVARTRRGLLRVLRAGMRDVLTLLGDRLTFDYVVLHG